MKRSYDYQRVRSHRPYTIPKLAELLGVSEATVRRWIRLNGLDGAIIDHKRPTLLQGAKVKAWLKARQKAKRQPCAPNEMYCMRCKTPRQIRPESFHIVQRNEVNLTVKGECVKCGSKLQRFGSVADRAALEAAFGRKPPDSLAA